jgi:hypothetical protein
MSSAARPPRVLIVSAGMPRAGSGWFFNLTHDLWRAAGGDDSHRIREQYHLQDVMTEVNCFMGSLVPGRLLRVMRPLLDGHSFVVKTHSRPSPLARGMISIGLVKPTYIFRDPRDAFLSAQEYGQRVLKDRGRPNAFSSLTSIEQGIPWMTKYVDVWRAWSHVRRARVFRYEDLLTDYDDQARNLADFLGVDLAEPQLQAVMEEYRPGRADNQDRGLHFYKGRIGRFHEAFSDEEKRLSREALEGDLIRMGYDPS